jgi:hypothetical protein
VDLAVARDRGVGGLLQLGLQRNVRRDPVDVGVGGPQALERLLERRSVDVAEHHLDPGLGERGRDAQAHSRCGPVTKAILPVSSFMRVFPDLAETGSSRTERVLPILDVNSFGATSNRATSPTR